MIRRHIKYERARRDSMTPGVVFRKEPPLKNPNKMNLINTQFLKRKFDFQSKKIPSNSSPEFLRTLNVQMEKSKKSFYWNVWNDIQKSPVYRKNKLLTCPINVTIQSSPEKRRKFKEMKNDLQLLLKAPIRRGSRAHTTQVSPYKKATPSPHTPTKKMKKRILPFIRVEQLDIKPTKISMILNKTLLKRKQRLAKVIQKIEKPPLKVSKSCREFEGKGKSWSFETVRDISKKKVKQQVKVKVKMKLNASQILNIVSLKRKLLLLKRAKRNC